MLKLKYIFRKYLKLVIAIILIALGVALTIFPVPFGFLLIIAGLLLLVSYVPFLDRWLMKLKKKDKNNLIEKAEDKIDDVEENVVDRIVEDPQKGK